MFRSCEPAPENGARPARNLKLMDDSPELLVIGLTCNLVGLFLLANSIVFRSPRKLIAEFFNVDKGSMRPLRDYVLNKIQVVIGFLFLTSGFLLQALWAWPKIERPTPVLLICGGLLALAACVYFVGNLYSRRAFKRHLRDFFQTFPFPFERNLEITKQIGKAFGIEEGAEDSVEVYVGKVKRALGLPPAPTPSQEGSARSRRLREMAAPVPPVSEHL